MVYRESQDKGAAILYLTADVALFRAGTNYAVVVAHWLNEPDYVMLTGDSIDRALVSDLRRVCYHKEGQILAGFGSRPSRPSVSVEDLAEYDDKFFVLRLGENPRFFNSEVEMADYVKRTFSISDLKLREAPEFFATALTNDLSASSTLQLKQ